MQQLWGWVIAQMESGKVILKPNAVWHLLLDLCSHSQPEGLPVGVEGAQVPSLSQVDGAASRPASAHGPQEVLDSRQCNTISRQSALPSPRLCTWCLPGRSLIRICSAIKLMVYLGVHISRRMKHAMLQQGLQCNRHCLFCHPDKSVQSLGSYCCHCSWPFTAVAQRYFDW